MNKYMNIHILLISKVINVMDNVLITGHSFVYIISYILIHFSSFHFNWTFICLSYSKDKLQQSLGRGSSRYSVCTCRCQFIQYNYITTFITIDEKHLNAGRVFISHELSHIRMFHL